MPGATGVASPRTIKPCGKGSIEALAALKADVFYRLDSVESNLVFGGHNPVNRGLPLDQVLVFWIDRPVPPLEEQREEIGRLLIDAFVRRRLIPLGCVRAAIDDAGKLCIAASPASTRISAARLPGPTWIPPRSSKRKWWFSLTSV